jgi:putative DNA primase/helicase
METISLFFANEPALIGYWQRLCGYAITGVIRDQILPIAYGTGANGKSTILGSLLDVLGPDYAMKASQDLFMAKKTDNHPTERASLFGKRIVVAIETEDGAKLAESMVKELTGSDMITARRMREDPWSFLPSHTLFLATNHKPQIKGTDHAIWRRLKLIPFNVRMDDASAKKNVPDLLKNQRAGILAWFVRGCLDWQANGLDTPETVTAATEEYRDDEDTLAGFVEEHCAVASYAKVKAGILYAKYHSWAEASGLGPLSIVRFGKAIEQRGHKKARSNGIWYHGIGLRANEPDF